MRRFNLIVLTSIILPLSILAQISYGGKPLPLLQTRGENVIQFEDMPAFDLEEELRLDSLNNIGLRGAYRFAYKFMTDFNRANSGYSFTLADGTKVWRLGIRSKGALSINVLFTEFEIPEGARLFLYNSDQTHILGSFTHKNNSDRQIFPVSPVEGEELIIEYQEPARAAFPGKLTVAEVNHAYRPLRDREPDGYYSYHYCMEPPACFPDDPLMTEELSRSVVLLIIDGSISCSGVMINNTSQDGTPYILTASHCINGNFTITDPDRYEVIAGSIICFFNYNSPLCSPVIRGTEEMSMSSTTLKAINEYVDMALLELPEIPPIHYQPYYAGWNISENPKAPYFGIHHPKGTVKRVSWLDDEIEYSTFVIRPIAFTENAHWLVKRWTAGSTDGGSSGSPFFDNRGLIIGALSGGYSTCENPEEDYYYALSKAWLPIDEDGNEESDGRQLKHWLNPTGSSQSSCNGFDPHSGLTPCVRLSNVHTNGDVDKITLDTIPNVANAIPLFSKNAYGIDTYMEEYNITGDALLYGTYLVTPSVGKNYAGLEIEICVYEGENQPVTLLHSETFQPKYADYSREKQDFTEKEKSLSRAQETFVTFSKPIQVKKKFYIGYKIISGPDNIYFTAYNLPDSVAVRNTTWIYYKDNWVEASRHPEVPMKTSLFIDPVIQAVNDVSNTPIQDIGTVRIIQSADRRSLHIILPDGTDRANLSLISMNGVIIQENRLNNNMSTVPVQAISPGIYLVRLIYGNQQFTQKIIF